MLRLTGHIASVVLVGVTMTIASCWSCALWSQWPVQRGRFADAAGAAWPIAVPEGWPQEPRVVLQAASFGYRVTAASSFRAINDPIEGRRLGIYRAAIHETGWPIRAMWWERFIDDETIWSRGGLPVPRAMTVLDIDVQRNLPLRARWGAFFLQSALFGLGTFAIVRGPGATRRLVRHLRGRCPGCGYHLHGTALAGCPECGWNRSDEATERPSD